MAVFEKELELISKMTQNLKISDLKTDLFQGLTNSFFSAGEVKTPANNKQMR